MLQGMWDLPGPGLEPVSPTLAGRFLTTAPPGKPPRYVLLNTFGDKKYKNDLSKRKKEEKIQRFMGEIKIHAIITIWDRPL